MNADELVQEFEKLAARLDQVVAVLEEEAATKPSATENRLDKVATDDFGRLSSIPSRSSNPLMDFILS